jgi:HlyD family secretion protein
MRTHASLHAPARRLLPGLLCAALALAAGVTGCARGSKETAAEPRSVKAVHAGLADITVDTDYAARIRPDVEVKVTAKISARAVSVSAKVGDAVSKGQVLLTLESRDYEDQYRQAEAALSSAKANLTRTGESSLDLQLLQAQAAVDQAQVQVDDAKSLYDKTGALFRSGVVTGTQLDDVEAKYKSAKIQLQTATDNLALIRQKAGPQSTDVASAQVDQAAAAASLARSRLNDAVVRSPMDGVVSYRAVEAGELVAAGVPVLAVMRVSRVLAQADVSEMSVSKVKPGMRVSVRVSALGEEVLSGIVDSVSPSADLRTQAYAVKVMIDNPGGSLRPGMLARLSFPLESLTGCLAVPNAAIFMEGGAEYVYTVKDGRARKVQVTTGLSDETLTQIVAGLSEGDLVITEGHDLLNDGDAVKIGQ